MSNTSGKKPTEKEAAVLAAKKAAAEKKEAAKKARELEKRAKAREKRIAEIAESNRPKQAAPKAEKKEKEKGFFTTERILFIAAAVICVVAVVAVVINAVNTRYTYPDVYVNGEQVPEEEVAFYYRNIYNNYVGSLSLYYGIDETRPMSVQYYDKEAGITWAKYFEQVTLDTVQENYILYNEAKAAGYTITAADLATAEEDMVEIKNICEKDGITVSEYLNLVYNGDVSETFLMSLLQRNAMGSRFYDESIGAMEFTDAEYETFYNEHLDEYRMVDYRVFFVDAVDYLERDEKGELYKEYPQEQLDEALAKAHDRAIEFRNTVKDEQSFIEACRKFATGTDLEMGTYEDDRASLNEGVVKKGVSSVYLADWLFKTGRAKGDYAVVDTEDGAYIVIVVSDYYRDEYDYAEIRQILKKVGSKATDKEKQVARETLEGIWENWKKAGTEGAFTTLAIEHSEDKNAAQGGLYVDVDKQDITGEFRDWVFDASRKVGDIGIVEDKDGLHLVYYKGTGDLVWQAEMLEAMQDAEYQKWFEAKQPSYVVEAK